MVEELSMPVEWAYLLMDKNPLTTYAELKEMSCGEVLDLLEIQSCRTLQSDIIADVQRNNLPKT